MGPGFGPQKDTLALSPNTRSNFDTADIFFHRSVLSFVLLCVSLRPSASPKKEHVSELFGVSYEGHVTQMAETRDTEFVEKITFTVIYALIQVFEDEEQSEKEQERSKNQTTALLVTLM